MLTTACYIEFLDANAAPFSSNQRYQPYFPAETRIYNGLAYQFAPFSIAGDISTDGSETGDYELIAPANIISGSTLWQASEGRYFISVQTILLVGTPPATASGIPTYIELSTLTQTICVCDTFGYADSVPGEEDEFSPMTLKLISPLNFVAGTSPTRRLTAAQVGPLPSSGGITF
jgi:hypothetical protein